VATYFDKREQREKTVPDCSKHGLVWNEKTQRCECPAFGDLFLLSALGWLIWKLFRK